MRSLLPLWLLRATNSKEERCNSRIRGRWAVPAGDSGALAAVSRRADCVSRVVGERGVEEGRARSGERTTHRSPQPQRVQRRRSQRSGQWPPSPAARGG